MLYGSIQKPFEGYPEETKLAHGTYHTKAFFTYCSVDGPLRGFMWNPVTVGFPLHKVLSRIPLERSLKKTFNKKRIIRNVKGTREWSSIGARQYEWERSRKDLQLHFTSFKTIQRLVTSYSLTTGSPIRFHLLHSN